MRLLGKQPIWQYLCHLDSKIASILRGYLPLYLSDLNEQWDTPYHIGIPSVKVGFDYLSTEASRNVVDTMPVVCVYPRDSSVQSTMDSQSTIVGEYYVSVAYVSSTTDPEFAARQAQYLCALCAQILENHLSSPSVSTLPNPIVLCQLNALGLQAQSLLYPNGDLWFHQCSATVNITGRYGTSYSSTTHATINNLPSPSTYTSKSRPLAIELGLGPNSYTIEPDHTAPVGVLEGTYEYTLTHQWPIGSQVETVFYSGGRATLVSQGSPIEVKDRSVLQITLWHATYGTTYTYVIVLGPIVPLVLPIEDP